MESETAQIFSFGGNPHCMWRMRKDELALFGAHRYETLYMWWVWKDAYPSRNSEKAQTFAWEDAKLWMWCMRKDVYSTRSPGSPQIGAYREETLECDACGKPFTTRDKVLWHLLVTLVKDPSKLTRMKRRLLHAEAKKAHILAFSEATSWMWYLRKDVLSRDELILQLLVHTGKRPFKCGKWGTPR